MHIVESKPTRPKFECKKCGACCRSLAGFEGFEELDRGDGVCVNFDEKTNLCLIYDKRPLLCRVDKIYDEMFADRMTYEDYLNLNYDSCKVLRQARGIPEPEEPGKAN